MSGIERKLSTSSINQNTISNPNEENASPKKVSSSLRNDKNFLASLFSLEKSSQRNKNIFSTKISSSMHKKKLLEGRDVLILGGGNFSWTKTHILMRIKGTGTRSRIPNPDYGSRVLATELKSKEELSKEDPKIPETIKFCEGMGSAFDFEIDGKKIDVEYDGHRFKRIQCNCLDLQEPFFTYGSELPETVFKIALASSNLQRQGDKLHYSVIAPNSNYHLFQALHYRITDVENAGYKLHAIKLSGPERYKYLDEKIRSFWEHKMTSSNASLELFNRGFVDEIIFVKTAENQFIDVNDCVPSHPFFKPQLKLENTKTISNGSKNENILEAEGYLNVLNKHGRKVRKVPAHGFYYDIKPDEGISSDSDSEISDLESYNVDQENFNFENENLKSFSQTMSEDKSLVNGKLEIVDIDGSTFVDNPQLELRGLKDSENYGYEIKKNYKKSLGPSYSEIFTDFSSLKNYSEPEELIFLDIGNLNIDDSQNTQNSNSNFLAIEYKDSTHF